MQPIFKLQNCERVGWDGYRGSMIHKLNLLLGLRQCVLCKFVMKRVIITNLSKIENTQPEESHCLSKLLDSV